MGKNAQRKARRYGKRAGLASGQSGTGHPRNMTEPAERGTHAARRETPYRIAGTTASQYSTRVAGNTTRIWRDER